jgi:hypothetical protein
MDRRPGRGHSWVGELVTVFAAIVVFFWFLQARKAPMQLMERRACERAYDEARTAAETLRVDSQNPWGAQAQDTVTVTCGALRRAGRL